VSVPGAQLDSTPQQAAQPRSTFSDWVGDEEEEVFFDNRPKLQRGGRKHKNKKGRQEEQEVDWDAIYDPSKPTNLARYQGSTEQEAERREWKEFLYYHASKRGSRVQKSKPKNSMALSKWLWVSADLSLAVFAPPRNLNFAPPSFDAAQLPTTDPMDVDDDDEYQPPATMSGQTETYERPAVAFAANPAAMHNDASGEDAYARRMRSSGMAVGASDAAPAAPAVQAFVAPATSTPSVPAIPVVQAPADIASKLQAAQAKLAAAKAKIEAARAQAANTAAAEAATVTSASVVEAPPSPPPPPPPPPPADDDIGTISRAPVRYNSSDALQNDQGVTAPPPAPDQSRSKAPGQKGFGARMMAKMGWEKGQGLGAKGEGITTALVAQAEKRKKRSDKDGGGWAQPRNMGKIVGGKKRKVETVADDDGEFGTMSYVIRLSGILTGLDVAHEIEENNLLQEIGEEFGGKYGSIERLFIWRDQNGGNNDVFVKFTSQLSALRAVNATDGMTFAENPVVARFFSTEKFEAGEYA
jgi:splicing factor 45